MSVKMNMSLHCLKSLHTTRATCPANTVTRHACQRSHVLGPLLQRPVISNWRRGFKYECPQRMALT